MTDQTSPKPVVPVPSKGDPRTWQRKAEIAKEAREAGKALRKGRPVTFSGRKTNRLAQ